MKKLIVVLTALMMVAAGANGVLAMSDTPAPPPRQEKNYLIATFLLAIV